MLGYECPCCGELITVTLPPERRDCPTCRASVYTQQFIKAKRACLPHCRAWGGGSVSVLICQVCSINPAKGVASCTFGPMSLAYCSECLAHKAEPLWAFDYTFDEVSENGEGMADWWLQMTTWKDGQYITWPDYVAQRQAHPTTGATP